MSSVRGIAKTNKFIKENSIKNLDKFVEVMRTFENTEQPSNNTKSQDVHIKSIVRNSEYKTMYVDFGGSTDKGEFVVDICRTVYNPITSISVGKGDRAYLEINDMQADGESFVCGMVIDDIDFIRYSLRSYPKCDLYSFTIRYLDYTVMIKVAIGKNKNYDYNY